MCGSLQPMKHVSSEVAPGDKNGRHKSEGKRRVSPPPRKKSQPVHSTRWLLSINLRFSDEIINSYCRN